MVRTVVLLAQVNWVDEAVVDMVSLLSVLPLPAEIGRYLCPRPVITIPGSCMDNFLPRLDRDMRYRLSDGAPSTRGVIRPGAVDG
jgi:hypothetical protein